jgi:hypothetical protein
VARLKETSSCLERKIMELSTKLQTVQQERDELTIRCDEYNERINSLLEERERSKASEQLLVDELRVTKDMFEELRSKYIAIEARLEETEDRLVNKERDDPQLKEPIGSRRHMRRLSMDSKLEEIAVMQTSLDLPTIPFRPVTVERTDLLHLLKDPRTADELRDLVTSSAGYDPRHQDNAHGPSSLLRLPARLLEHWIATWLELDPEPLLLGDQFYALMSAIKAVCVRAIDSVIPKPIIYSFFRRTVDR